MKKFFISASVSAAMILSPLGVFAEGITPTASTSLTVQSMRINQIFPGKTLASIIASDLGKNVTDTVTQDELNSIGSVNIDYNLDGDSINLSGIGNLANLQILTNSVGTINSIDLSKNIQLTKLSLQGLNVSIFELNKNVNLTSLSLMYSNIKNVVLTQNVNLTDVYLELPDLSNIEFPNSTSLANLKVLGGNINNIDLSKVPNLKILSMSYVNLDKIDLSHNPNLEMVNLEHNHFSSIDLSESPNLSLLTVNSNNLTDINLPYISNLMAVDISFNQLDLTKMPFHSKLLKMVQENGLQYVYSFQQFTVDDKTPPVTPKINSFSNKDTKITGKSEAGATVKLYINGKYQKAATVDAKGNFSFSIAKQKAGTLINVIAADKAQNKSCISFRVIDRTPPVTPKINSFSNKDTKITGKSEAGATVKLYINGKYQKAATVDEKGNFSFSIAKQKVGALIKVIAVDKSKNESRYTIKVIDKAPPATPSVNPVTTTSKTIIGKAEIGATVYVYNGKTQLGNVTVDKKGNFLVKIKTLKKGTRLTIYAVDKSSNKGNYRVVTIN
jgi:uncharacterized protein YjbI with pentapeptide repeats